MFDVDTRSRIPIYEQLKDQILNFIRVGILEPDAKLPSIRSVALEIGANVNTVKRAFQELEMDGVIYTVAGKGSFVSPTALDSNSAAEKALDSIEEQIRSAKHKGVKKEEMLKLINRIYEEDDE
ncbi:MAG: GntR family transcriptional regulator [Acutalibacteraceae bacterium]|nr:GntR family transcriptional regulator [Oscillospiraceae bacterium]